MGLYDRHVCPHLVELFLGNRWVEGQRAWLLEPLRGEVLEIGFGTGLNLPHYPGAVEKLVALDPAEGMHEKARRRLSKSPVPVESHRLEAERLPFADESFDEVVCTFTLCTIPDPVRALAEVRRVLRPSGRLHLLEHVGSEHVPVRRWQERLNPLQNALGGGCNIDRDVEPLLRRAGFEDVELERLRQPRSPSIYREHVRGRVRR